MVIDEEGCGGPHQWLGKQLVRCWSFRQNVFFEHLLFAIHQGIYIVWGQFKSVTVCDRVGRARFHAVTAKNASRIVDVVNRSIAFAGRDAIGVGIFRGFDVYAIRRTRRRAEKTPDTFFQSILVTMQDVDSAVARLEIYRLFRITFRHTLTKHCAECHAETIEHGPEDVEHFTNRGCHATSLANGRKSGKQAPLTRTAHAVR